MVGNTQSSFYFDRVSVLSSNISRRHHSNSLSELPRVKHKVSTNQRALTGIFSCREFYGDSSTCSYVYCSLVARRRVLSNFLFTIDRLDSTSVCVLVGIMRVPSSTMTSAFTPPHQQKAYTKIRENCDAMESSWPSPQTPVRPRTSCEPNALHCPTTPMPLYFPSKVSPHKSSKISRHIDFMSFEPCVATMPPRKVSWGSMDVDAECPPTTPGRSPLAADDETLWYDLNLPISTGPVLPDLDDSSTFRKPLLMRRSHSWRDAIVEEPYPMDL